MFTEIDIVVSLIITISVVFSFFRGFLKDFSSILVWVSTLFVTIVFYPYANVMIEDIIANEMVRNIVAIALLFLCAFICISIITSIILGIFAGMRQNIIDRSFGMVLGFVKGVFIVSMLHFILVLISEEEPAKLKQGQTYAITNFGALLIKDIVFEQDIMDKLLALKIDDDSDIKDLTNLQDIDIDIANSELLQENIISQDDMKKILKKIKEEDGIVSKGRIREITQEILENKTLKQEQ